MKLYLSADMEGTAGIISWSEATADHPRYPYFQEQMSREVAAACEGALAAGATEILVKDAHDSACNIIPSLLPENVKLFRGWDNSPEMMMAELDASFDGVLFTGYHAAANSVSNPLSHTMSLSVQSITCNGRLMAEFDINALIAAQHGVPVFFLSGDKGLCQTAKETIPQLHTVAANEGFGSGAITLQPAFAVSQIRKTVQQALQTPIKDCLYPIPPYYKIEVCFKEHTQASKALNYPGVKRSDAKTVRLESDNLTDILRAFFWIL